MHRDANIERLLISIMATVLVGTANVGVGGTACTDTAFDDDMDVARARHLAGKSGRLCVANSVKCSWALCVVVCLFVQPG